MWLPPAEHRYCRHRQRHHPCRREVPACPLPWKYPHAVSAGTWVPRECRTLPERAEFPCRPAAACFSRHRHEFSARPPPASQSHPVPAPPVHRRESPPAGRCPRRMRRLKYSKSMISLVLCSLCGIAFIVPRSASTVPVPPCRDPRMPDTFPVCRGFALADPAECPYWHPSAGNSPWEHC